MNHEPANETGALYKGNGNCLFRVWAPEKEKINVHIGDGRSIEMNKDKFGYFSVEVADIIPGTKYKLLLGGDGEFPDPASFYQPDGVHGYSAIVDHGSYQWSDGNWTGREFGELILYEIHVGTFTKQGTFEAIIPLLDDLADTGINAIELMPVGQFSGGRNWGYDGVYPYAVQNTYGGPEGLKRLVDACHQKSISVFLDVIYNHIGPEGNYFAQFGPYFSDKYHMPWGDALNFDGDWSDGVKDYFSNNTIYWFDKYHIDGLRLDAIHTIYDDSAVNFWEITSAKVKAFENKCGRKLHMIAESDFNSPRVINSPRQGGYGFDAQWLDDFHHSLYTLLDAQGKKRYDDYGTMQQLAKAYKEGFVLSGDWVNFRKRKFGSSSADVPGDKFVVFNQNHDQVGNRVKGERLSRLVDFERLKIAAAAVLLSPYVPMLFMGEEYGEDRPFYFFVSHSEEKLITAVREGRKKDFSAFEGEGEFPDPNDDKTFSNSIIDWSKRKEGKYAVMLGWHKALISIRKQYDAFKDYDKNNVTADTCGDQGFILRKNDIYCVFNLSEKAFTCNLDPGRYELILDSREAKWMEKMKQGERPSFNGSQVTMTPLSVVVWQQA
ncbi:MAG: malto-oligosyltrehalose trehalohydrolase [Chitinophagaceae bacterium]|nr:malto-oligosyltrehalose trehalohydrolase [Chitinophagaceae bacterium]